MKSDGLVMPATALNEPGPVYLRLAGVLEGMIRHQSLRPGDRVPSVRRFGRQQHVSVPTSKNAYAALEDRGSLRRSNFFSVNSSCVVRAGRGGGEKFLGF